MYPRSPFSDSYSCLRGQQHLEWSVIPWCLPVLPFNCFINYPVPLFQVLQWFGGLSWEGGSLSCLWISENTDEKFAHQGNISSSHKSAGSDERSCKQDFKGTWDAPALVPSSHLHKNKWCPMKACLFTTFHQFTSESTVLSFHCTSTLWMICPKNLHVYSPKSSQLL